MVGAATSNNGSSNNNNNNVGNSKGKEEQSEMTPYVVSLSRNKVSVWNLSFQQLSLSSFTKVQNQFITDAYT